jgi:glycerol kinase
MATNEIKNSCGSSIEAVLASNQKRRRVLTLDQGTTSSRALVIDHSGKVISVRPVTGRLTGIPIAAIAGDQQAALFGRMCSSRKCAVVS